LTKGYVALILHAHLPYVRHPEYSNFLEEKWLFEAISETYLPIIDVFEKLISEKANYYLTMSITPTLLSMLTDSLLQNKYIKYLEKLIELSEKEVERTRNNPDFHHLAVMYNKKYKNDLYIFKDKFKCNIVKAFKKLQDSGRLEIIAGAATHGFLPLMGVIPETVNAQITVGVKSYEKHFGKKPRGIWLPECGYIPAVEKVLVGKQY
jgi:1,4-alpha-glucan branching enzyme